MAKQASLGVLGSKFFALMQMNQQTIVRIGDLQSPLEISASTESSLLKRLARTGFIFRLKAGVYLVPNKIPAGGTWQPNDYYLVANLMECYEANFYIGGLAALNYHGFIQQIPNSIVIYNDKISKTRQVGALRVVCIKVANDRISGKDKITLKDNTEVYIANPARAVMDAIYDWKRFNTLPKAYQWIVQRKNDSVFIDDLVSQTANYSNYETIIRIGYYLESLGIGKKITNNLLQKLKPTKSYVILDPTGPKEGVKNKAWSINCNVDIDRGTN